MSNRSFGNFADGDDDAADSPGADDASASSADGRNVSTLTTYR